MSDIAIHLILKCRFCDYRPPAGSTMGEFDLHMRLEHSDDEAHMDLVAVCTCDTIMTFVETTGDGLGFRDHFVCPTCFNRGTIQRGPEK